MIDNEIETFICELVQEKINCITSKLAEDRDNWNSDANLKIHQLKNMETGLKLEIQQIYKRMTALQEKLPDFEKLLNRMCNIE
jgi:hypothetical protein